MHLQHLIVLVLVIGYTFATSTARASGATYSCRPPYNPNQIPGNGPMSNALGFNSKLFKSQAKFTASSQKFKATISNSNLIVSNGVAHTGAALTGNTQTRTFYCKVCQNSYCDIWSFEFHQPVSVLNGLETFCPEGLGSCMCSTVATRLLQDQDAPTRRLGEQLQTALANGIPPSSICGGTGALDFESVDDEAAELEEQREALEQDLYE